jgi:hypothetical protein
MSRLSQSATGLVTRHYEEQIKALSLACMLPLNQEVVTMYTCHSQQVSDTTLTNLTHMSTVLDTSPYTYNIAQVKQLRITTKL